MQKTRIPSPWLSLTLGLSLAVPAGAMGFGDGSPSAVLGQTLDFAVDLRLDAGETLDPSCVRAKVLIGDRAVPPERVGTSLVSRTGGGQAIRVRTLQRIDEPVVSIQVEAGCSVRMLRRYVVFADPPAIPAVPVAAAPSPPEEPRPTTAAVPVSVAPAVAATAPVSPPPRAPRAAPPSPRNGAAPSTPRPAPRAESGAPASATPAAPPPARPAPAPARARLRLDPAPPMAASLSPPLPDAAEQALQLVDQANEAVKAAIAAASASQSRMAALEASVRQLTADAAAQRESVERLRARAAQAERHGSWMLPLALAVLALLVLAAWLWLRLRELEQERQRSWLAAAHGATRAAAAAPIPPSPSRVPLLVERSVRTTGVAALGAGLAPVHEATPSELPDAPSTAPQEWYTPESSMAQTRPLVPAGARPDPGEAETRAVSAEELIDLEQQAEFFVVLGQDDAAIDLLVSHLRDSGGASPLPYLKLLEIYRRLGDEAAYERTRQRFNQRFNAHAPGWATPAGDGRTLSDYPTVIGWIQHVWPKPLDAMAELESLLFRKDGGELFDLPAYRELLFLYALARDLLDSGSGGAGAGVDVLLPLNDSPGFDATSPRPYFGDEAMAHEDMQATAPIDLDLDVSAEDNPASRRH